MMNTNSTDICIPADHATVTAYAFLPWLLLGLLAVLLIWLLPKLQTYLMELKPVIVDGVIILLVSMFLFSQTYFSSDEAYKYVSPYVLFWMKYSFGLGGAAFLALKAFRYSPPLNQTASPDAQPKNQ